MFQQRPKPNASWLSCGACSKINPSDCVDMDCDALKKAMVSDTDGSLLGSPGYVLPNAGFEWDGDPRRGIGDYRIPMVGANWCGVTACA